MKPGFLDEVNKQNENIESFEQEKFVKVSQKKKPFLLIGVLIIALAIGTWFMMNRSVEVLDFEGWALSDVNEWTKRNDIQLVYKAVYSHEEVDTIIKQDVAMGSRLNSGSVLVVEVSQGLDPEALIELPNFDETWDKTSLLKWLTDQQITTYRFDLAIDKNLNQNALISYSIGSDATDGFRRNDELVFIINQSSQSETLIVPDLSSSTITDIQTWASESGLKLLIQEVFSEYVASGKFVSQSVSANSTIETDSELIVYLSKGAAVRVADFKNLDLTEAKIWATENNMILSSVSMYSNIQEGSLVSQSIKAGTSLEEKSKITVIYSLGNMVTLGSYTNSSITSLTSFVDAQNALGASLKLNISKQYSSTVPVNRIIATSISDAKINKDSTIDVIVSLGALVQVPDFTHLTSATYIETYNALLNAAKSANVTIRIVSRDDADLDTSNMIITQSLAPNALCSSADIIDIEIVY